MEQEKTHWKKQFNYDYLGAYSIPTEGGDLVLTIKEVGGKEKVKDAKGQESELPVIRFAEKGAKPLILNKTNAKAIQKVYGSPFMEDWIGKKIALYSTIVNAFGTDTDAIRVRQFKPLEKVVDITAAAASLKSATTLADLETKYKSLSKDEMYNKDVIELVKTLKPTLK